MKSHRFSILDCFWLLDDMLKFASSGELTPTFSEHKESHIKMVDNIVLPKRMEGMSLEFLYWVFASPNFYIQIEVYKGWCTADTDSKV